ncbi:D-aminoacylase [Nitratireductor aquimarinus]|uniref:N-acyl-D-amino-acid deacylase family protein n=1 Tax=Nitratireductor TaxID=245876 RepID=UPI0019D36F93|nr:MULTISPECIES: D-aminoacylase [Nitratireductor]MBN7776449.1 D-aminoacylase [Nitratireductor pacificus]MBN7779316.1 D-aminoacylase [Nitratireductor pacificus]MBN7788123.1 D-aminoacylase [Nitratireductor aquimarinus]MBY6098170.1 D-aminoacylase [Nitratireductor aquimarinus]MCA1259447.1 D-aminoacylase [Nitratireductor aquimarinus]
MHADLIIRGADIIDGTGAPRRKGDVAVSDDRIVATGDLKHWTAGREIEAKGRVVAPGFIDPHVHHDAAMLTQPDMEFMTSQGVTSVINGNCGFSIAPLVPKGEIPAPLRMIIEDEALRFETYAAYRDRLLAEPAAVNAACLIGHSTLRVNELPDLNKAADAAQLKEMCRKLDRALGEGAIGLSTGPFYPPARASTTEELIEVAKITQAHGKLYVTHMRDEGDRVVQGLEETFTVGRESCCGVHVSHHKCAGLANHGMSVTTLKMIDDAMQKQDVGLDTTPWIASSTILDSGRHRQATRVIVAESEPYPQMAGRDLSDIAGEWGTDIDTALQKLLPATGIFFIMSEDDVQRILSYEHTIICSDGIPSGKHPHPRVWGTFPRVLGHYARDLSLFSLEEAVRRMTSMPADRFGLGGRGRIAVGGFADLVIFDPETIAEGATFETPIRPAVGIDRVFVNGREVWVDGEKTGARPGRPLEQTAPCMVV